jgi:hypothetical protein
VKRKGEKGVMRKGMGIFLRGNGNGKKNKEFGSEIKRKWKQRKR